MTRLAEFWVGVAFFVFVAILLYYRVPKLIAKALDERAEAIRHELDEARRLRQDAQELLAEYQSKHRNVAGEAEAIVEQARRDAETFADETRAALKGLLERRTKSAQEKIARAQAQATDEVRAKAVDVALAAAEKILREKVDGAALIEQSIRELKGRLN
jgi:F-type H+-transporting ATPase subunit b